jgi:hypothetical protein
MRLPFASPLPPTRSRSFTCTLFLPWRLFEDLDADPASRVQPFFQRHFPDALTLVPRLEEQFAGNPTSEWALPWLLL